MRFTPWRYYKDLKGKMQIIDLWHKEKMLELKGEMPIDQRSIRLRFQPPKGLKQYFLTNSASPVPSS